MVETEVWLPLLTLLIGYVGSLATEWWRDKRVAEREERIRWTEREQTRADRRDTFQRETLLALQDALGRYVRATAQVRHHDLMTSRTAGRWTKTLVPEDVDVAFFRAGVDVNTFLVRTLDEDLRGVAYLVAQ